VKIIQKVPQVQVARLQVQVRIIQKVPLQVQVRVILSQVALALHPLLRIIRKAHLVLQVVVQA